MYFADVAHEIADGDLLLFRGRRFYSRVIQLWTRSVYSHVGIAHRLTTGGRAYLDVLEAREGRGVQTFPLAEYLQCGSRQVDWFQIVDPRIDRAAVVRWAMDRRGKRYASPRQMVRSFFTVPLFDFLEIPTRIDSDRYFCSFFATEALFAGGWSADTHDFVRPELASPGAVSLYPCVHRRGTLVLNDTRRGT